MKTIIKNGYYELPAFWACALLYGDMTGFSDDDEKAFNSWMDAVKPGDCVSIEPDNGFMRYHDASDYVLACETVIAVFHTYEQPEKLFEE